MRISHLEDSVLVKRSYGELILLAGPSATKAQTRKLDLKTLHIAPGRSTSHHFHLERETVFYVLEGTVRVISRRASIDQKIGRETTVVVHPGEDHTLTNVGDSEAVVLEIESPPHASMDKISFSGALEPPASSRAAGEFWNHNAGVKVKICGVKSPDVAVECLRLGVHAIGIHAIGFRGIETALSWEGWINRLPSELTVFLLLDIPDKTVVSALLSRIQCDTVQIQGDPSESEWIELAALIRKTGRKVVKTVASSMATTLSTDQSARQRIEKNCDAVLVDSASYGGTGRVHDWEVTAALRKVLRRPLILAGGLMPANCRKAINQVRPYAIDVESGVETVHASDARVDYKAKDFSKVAELIRQASLSAPH